MFFLEDRSVQMQGHVWFLCFVLFFSQNALIQDLENCQKQLEEFHHTRVSMALVNHLKTIKKTQLSSCFQRSCLIITGDFLQKYSFLVHVS